MKELEHHIHEAIGLVAHELRTPLGVMIGWIDILKDRLNGDPEISKALETIDRNAKIQIHLVNDLLDISRIMSGKMRIAPVADTSIDQLIADVISDLTPTASAKGLRIEKKPGREVRAPIDPNRMRQIVWNLISNSIKFTPKGGMIEVAIEAGPSSYQLRVRDDGIGIERDQLARIFDRFTQVIDGTTRTGGLGLGLSIVKALVELHGGHVAVESCGRDRGTTFIATFPHSEARPDTCS